ncbi:MAG: APC family permease [Gammaproteobacteria bacterium]|jgi:amino acid transporter
MSKKNDKIGFLEATSIGIGGMVGGGIFAVLGLAVSMARGGTLVAFAIAGAIALITAYAYVKLSVALPGPGGTVSYLDKAYGKGALTGTLNVLLWLSYIVMLSLYAYAFGSYGATFFPETMQPLARHGLISGIILVIAVLNAFSADLIGRAEDLIVGLKLLILLIFIGTGVAGIDPARLAPAAWSPALNVVAGGMIIFLAYEGFELIANTAADVRNPSDTLPRAFYTAVIGVIVLYLLVAAVTVGNLPLEKIIQARDYALAAAAEPFLGQSGFTLIAIAALLSTASAINATVYGAARLSFIIARDGELPELLEKKIWHKPLEGLIFTALATLVVANTLNLSSISTVGSAGFLLIFAAVNGANVRLHERTGARRWLSILGVIACLGALGALVWRTALTGPSRLCILAGMPVAAAAIEYSYRFFRRRHSATF